MQQNGAILGTVLAEGLGLILQIIFAWDLLKKTELFSVNTIKIVFSAIIMFLSLTVFNKQFNLCNEIVSLILKIVIAVFVYLLCLLIFREKTVKKIILKK